MGKFYSDTLEDAIKLIYFQSNPARYPEGVILLEKAVEEGEPDAYYFLARCCAWEDGDVPEDELRARQLSREGIARGSDLCVLGADRMNALQGDVRAAMTKTLKESFEAVVKKAEAGEPMAQYAVGLFYFWGDIHAVQPKPATQQEAVKLEKDNAAEALKWFRLSADQGCIPAFRNAFNSVRMIFLNGWGGIPVDKEEAFRLFLRSSTSFRVGVYNLARCYYNGWGVEEDKEEAFKHFTTSAEMGYREAQRELAWLYYEGYGVNVNYEKCIEWANKSANQGCGKAKTILGKCYFYGKGVRQDYEAARRMFSAAAQEADDGEAYHFLGDIYDQGIGVEAKIPTAVIFYQKALSHGYQDAAKDLARFRKTIFGRWKRRKIRAM